MTEIPPEPSSPRVHDYLAERIARGLGEPVPPTTGEGAAPIDVGGHGPHPPGMEIGERLARLESGQEWTKIVLGLIGAIVIGGFAFLGVQIGRLDAKIDSLGTRISAENATTRQELIG